MCLSLGITAFAAERDNGFTDVAESDLSFWLEEPQQFGENVFVTDDYSVENYVVNRQSFEICLRKFEGFARAKKPSSKTCYNIAQVQIEIFCTGLRSVAKAAAGKRRGDVYNEKKGNLLEQQI